MSQPNIVEFTPRPIGPVVRTMDSAFLEKIANHPDVRPWLGGSGPLRFDAIFADPNNLAFQTEHGGFIVHKLDLGIYECHSMFLPAGRGGEARQAMVDSLRYMFTKTDCMEIVTKAPDDNPAAFGAARAMGFVSSFRLERGWKTQKGEMIGVECMRLPFSKWLRRDDKVEKFGDWFQEQLESGTKMAFPGQFSERSYRHSIGATVMMIQAGNVIKGVSVYNLWAKFALFPMMKLLSLTPTVVEFDQIVIEFNSDGEMEILKCPQL